MKYNKISRRMFLEGAGKASLAIPFLPSLFPEMAQAATPSTSKFITVQSDYFIGRELAIPGYYDSSVPFTQVDANTKTQLLTDMIKKDGKLSYIFDEKWNPYLNKINIVSGTNAYMQSFLHNATMASAACSVSNGDYSPPIYPYSIDYLVEQAIYRGGAAPAFGALRYNLWGTNNQNETSWGYIDGKTTGLANSKNLTQLQTSLSSYTSKDAAKVLNRRKLIDAVLPELSRLKANARLSKLDKDRLNEATDRWNDIQNRTGSNMNCNFTAATQGENWAVNHQLSMQLAVQALACNMTRVVAYTLFQGGDDNPQGMHNYAHDARNRNFNDMQKWRAQRVADFVGYLNAAKDENGTSLLDTSLLQWNHEYSGWGHQKYGYVTLTAGGANGKIKSGYHIDLGGTPINNFHITNMMAVGLSLSDIEKDGRTGFGEYATTVLYQDGSPDPVRSFDGYIERDVDYWDKQYGKIDREYSTPANYKNYFTTENKRKLLWYSKA